VTRISSSIYAATTAVTAIGGWALLQCLNLLQQQNSLRSKILASQLGESALMTFQLPFRV
jgi:hypothetical protein